MKRWQIIAGAVVAFAIIVAAIVLISVAGAWPIVLDIVLIITALISLAVLVLLAAAVFYLATTLLDVKRELTPVLESLQSTTQTVSATAKVASDLGVGPTVRTASVLVGAAEAATVILGRGHVRARAQKRAQRREEVARELMARGELNGSR